MGLWIFLECIIQFVLLKEGIGKRRSSNVRKRAEGTGSAGRQLLTGSRRMIGIAIAPLAIEKDPFFSCVRFSFHLRIAKELYI